MEVGDTVYVGLNMDYLAEGTAKFILQSIDTVEIFNVRRRMITLLIDPCNGDRTVLPMEWIEGIGSTMHPFYPLMRICDCYESSYSLLCHDSTGVQLHQHPAITDRDTLFLGIQDEQEDEGFSFNAFHDPVGDALVIGIESGVPGRAVDDADLMMITADGRIVRQQRWSGSGGTTRKALSGISSGAYRLHLSIYEGAYCRSTDPDTIVPDPCNGIPPLQLGATRGCDPSTGQVARLS